MSDIATPCTKICVVDPASGLCLGCLRSILEIGGWMTFDDAAREAILRDLPARRAALGSRHYDKA